ncbi:hypothetical protein N431DRAFT_357463 [Stipitochalara longipes BDJ]|nr:hypothetical protein N431DRAFT_357463 [Stipitochalara longipes BDJ]
MNPYQSDAVPTAGLGDQFGGDNIQDLQDQNTTPWPSSSSQPTAMTFDAHSLEPSTLESTSQQNSGPAEGTLSRADFRCEICSKTYSRQYELTKHRRNHTKPLRCHLCPEGFAQQKDLDRHFWVHHESYAQFQNIPDPSEVCQVCGHRARGDNLKRHQKRTGH